MIIILKNKPLEMIIIKHEYAYMGYVFFICQEQTYKRICKLTQSDDNIFSAYKI